MSNECPICACVVVDRASAVAHGGRLYHPACWGRYAADLEHGTKGGVRPAVTAEALPPAISRLFNRHEVLCARARELLKSKNHDYRGGSGDPYANFRGSTAFGIDPIVGLMLRMQDKLMRIKTFAEKGTLQVKSEGVEDAIIDLINYSVLMAGLCAELAEQADTAKTAES